MPIVCRLSEGQFGGHGQSGEALLLDLNRLCWEGEEVALEALFDFRMFCNVDSERSPSRFTACARVSLVGEVLGLVLS